MTFKAITQRFAQSESGSDSFKQFYKDAFDLMKETPAGPIRMIGAGTLSTRLRASRPSFNVLRYGRDTGLEVENRSLALTPDED